MDNAQMTIEEHRLRMDETFIAGSPVRTRRRIQFETSQFVTVEVDGHAVAAERLRQPESGNSFAMTKNRELHAIIPVPSWRRLLRLAWWKATGGGRRLWVPTFSGEKRCP